MKQTAVIIYKNSGIQETIPDVVDVKEYADELRITTESGRRFRKTICIFKSDTEVITFKHQEENHMTGGEEVLRMKIRAVLAALRTETRQAVEEWDHAKAAGFRRAAELIEKAFDPETETTAEQIGRKERKDDKR